MRKILRDKVALPFISGVLGTLVMYAIGFPMYFLKITKLLYLLYTIELFVTPDIARTTPGFLAGALAGLIIGGVLAIGFKLLMEWTGSDWLWLKTLGYGALMWFLWVGLTRNLLEVAVYINNDLPTNMLLLVQSLVYSLATTYFMIKLSGGAQYLQIGEK